MIKCELPILLSRVSIINLALITMNIAVSILTLHNTHSFSNQFFAVSILSETVLFRVTLYLSQTAYYITLYISIYLRYSSIRAYLVSLRTSQSETRKKCRDKNSQMDEKKEVLRGIVKNDEENI